MAGAWQGRDSGRSGILSFPSGKLPGKIVHRRNIRSFANALQCICGTTRAKHGALGLTKTLREELRPKGIRVIALMLGAVDTDIWKSFWSDAPRKKMMSVETAARAVVDALRLPDNSTVEELVIRPTAGTL